MKLFQTGLLLMVFTATLSFADEPASSTNQASVYEAAKQSTPHDATPAGDAAARLQPNAPKREATQARTGQRPDAALATQLLGWTG